MMKMTDSASGKQTSEIWIILEQRPGVAMLAVLSGILIIAAALMALDILGLAPWLGPLDKRVFNFRQLFS